MVPNQSIRANRYCFFVIEDAGMDPATIEPLSGNLVWRGAILCRGDGERSSSQVD